MCGELLMVVRGAVYWGNSELSCVIGGLVWRCLLYFLDIVVW